MTAVVSAIFGGYDQPKPVPPQSTDCTFTMVTDDPDLEAPGWDLFVITDVGWLDPRMAAKVPKLRPWGFADGGPWIWMDGSFQIMSATFVEEVVAAADGHLLAQWEHPDRTCIYPEAEVSATLPKYADTPVLKQAANYRVAGHPARWGLWAAGLIVYRDPVDDLADVWWNEMECWGYQDQISQPVALRATGMRPRGLPWGLRSNPWLRLVPHVDGTC
jgi:hypothetical protein